MTKNKYLLYLLICGLLLYYAFPHLSVHGHPEEALFAVSWLFLFLCAFAGNLLSFLHALRNTRKSGQFSAAKSGKTVAPYRKLRG